ncbi:site-specific recombinase XerD [Krasilnikovia cinnamomea]|uniref:Site-specific recombinase XerD n=1 Tax=Krasilnikovia cinnamomea TaxID=349313 RepID=A0A4Q7Z9W7_9ACTN|nr:tyrosine-type recombinase/integrase [Krasilnikovia cinnamomea]RZU46685.1 site-specific recombinase XerD [Krasilnikovia cinnamomea]
MTTSRPPGQPAAEAAPHTTTAGVPGAESGLAAPLAPTVAPPPRPATPAPLGVVASATATGPDLSGPLAAATRQIARWAAGLPGLPADDGSRYSIRRLTVAWNLDAWGRSQHTAIAHRRDLSTYLDWCQLERLDPLTARPTDLSQFRVWRELHGTRGRSAAPSTVARALASVSSWYTHLIANTEGRIPRNPLTAISRPAVSAHTSRTVGLTLAEVDQLLAHADIEAEARQASWEATPSPRQQARHLAALRDRALLRLLADLGLRIGEALARDLDDLSYNAGQRTLRFVGKGSQQRERPLPAHTLEALDDYLAARAAATGCAVDALTGPLFATTSTDGTPGRLAEPNVFTWLRRLALTAGIPAAKRLSPHSLRHAFATGARQAGVPLEDVQDAMGHADPRTTRRYDRDRHNLDRDPAHILGASRASRRATQTRAADDEGGLA